MSSLASIAATLHPTIPPVPRSIQAGSNLTLIPPTNEATTPKAHSTPENARSTATLGNRYEFARGFTPSSITILQGTRKLYHLSDFRSMRKKRYQPSVLLSASATPTERGEGEPVIPVVTFYPRLFRSDIIKIWRSSSREDDDSGVELRIKVSLRSFLKTWGIQDIGPIIQVTVAHPTLLGLPDGTSLLWRLSSDRKSMTLYSAASWGSGAWSNLLAQAFFSQSVTSETVKLTAIETVEGITELLLIYTFISASIIESRLSKQHRQAKERQYLEKVKGPKWTITPFGMW